MQSVGTVAFTSSDLSSIKLNVPSSFYVAAESLRLCNHAAIPSERPPTLVIASAPQ